MKVTDIFDEMNYGPAPESAKTVYDWLSSHSGQFTHFIDGRWQAPASDHYFETINPSNGTVLTSIAAGNDADINKAVDAAKRALPAWSRLPGEVRGKYLYAIARQVQKHARLFAVLESIDNGKPIRESRDIDVPLVARHFYHHAGWAILSDTTLKEYEAIGVVGQIIPWNFPLLMLAWKIAPALAMGNTVILKPAEQTPLTALLFGEICERIGLPPGVVNIITGDGSAGSALVRHQDVQKIAFTGSTEVGRLIRQVTAGTGKRLSLELGGKSPFIIFEDADLDSAVEGLVDAIWFNQGQVCCAGSRLLVQENIADKAYEKLKSRMSQLRVGDALDKGIDIGAIVSQRQLATIERLCAEGQEEGAKMWQPETACPVDGYYFRPTLFTDVAPSATIAQEEIFGPVLVSMTFRSPAEAVQLANNTRYGLAASIWTENISTALDIAPKVKAGTIWINSTNVFDAASGFGGYRESGFGREGGKEGLYEYVRLRQSRFTGQPDHFDVLPLLDMAKNDLDRTAKLYIGGKQVRPDGGYSMDVFNRSDHRIGEVSLGNRKDIRNAVEAARKASSWTTKTGHARAQVLYFLAENLGVRRDHFLWRIQCSLEVDEKHALFLFETALSRVMRFAAWADKYDGSVHHTTHPFVTMAMPEALGVMGVAIMGNHPFLGFITTLVSTIAMGNRVVIIPDQIAALLAIDFYQVLETSDIPAGVVNIITGDPFELAPVLAGHDDVDGVWFFGPENGYKEVEKLAAGNMKCTWVSSGKDINWHDPNIVEGEYLLRKATQVKNIWIPYGV